MISSSRLATFALLFGGMTLFGTATPLSKIVVGSFPVFTASLLRVILGTLFLLPVFLKRGWSPWDLTRRDWLVVGGIALLGMFGFTLLLLLGMRLVPGVVGAIVMSTAPAVTAVASVLFLDDSWTPRKVSAIVLAVAGVSVINLTGSTGRDGLFGPPLGPLVLGSVLVLGAVCCGASFTLLGKIATRRLEPFPTVFLAGALAIPLFLGPALAEVSVFDPGGVPLRAWIAAAVWGGGTLGLGSIAWYSGLARASGTVAAGFMGVMPVSALLSSYVLLDEPVRIGHLIGFGIVFAGVVLVSSEHAEGR